MGLVFIIWSCITLFLLGTAEDGYDFLRSIGFIIICVGYILIIAGYYMFKDVFREDRY